MSKKRRKPNTRPAQPQASFANAVTGEASSAVMEAVPEVSVGADRIPATALQADEAPAMASQADEVPAMASQADEAPARAPQADEAPAEAEVSPIREVLREHSFYAPRASGETDWDADEEAEEEEYNRASVNRLKKAILVALILMFLIPTILCLILLTKMHGMEKEIQQLREDFLSKKEQMQAEQAAMTSLVSEADGQAKLERDREGDINMLHQSGSQDVSTTEGQTEETTEVSEAAEQIDPATVPEEKRVYLTFDDGPSDDAEAILDILKEKDVKATFFMVINDKSRQSVIRRMAADGHTLGIHSASHVYSEIYADLDSFRQDVQTVHDLLYDMTGQDVKLYRFPGGSSNRVSDVPVDDCIAYLEEAGYTYFDWNASNGDSSGSGYTAEQLEDNVLRYVHNNSGATVVLMHDFKNCPATAESLPHLIDTLREEGYVLLPIDETTAPVHHRKTAKELEEEQKVEQAILEKKKEADAVEQASAEENDAEEADAD